MSLPSAFEEGTPVAMPRRETLRKRGAEPEGKATGGEAEGSNKPEAERACKEEDVEGAPKTSEPEAASKEEAELQGEVRGASPLF